MATGNGLKPCPWCNGKAFAEPPSLGRSHWNGVCDDCGASGPHGHDEGQAIRQWNARATLPPGNGLADDEVVERTFKPGDKVICVDALVKRPEKLKKYLAPLLIEGETYTVSEANGPMADGTQSLLLHEIDLIDGLMTFKSHRFRHTDTAIAAMPQSSAPKGVLLDIIRQATDALQDLGFPNQANEFRADAAAALRQIDREDG